VTTTAVTYSAPARIALGGSAAAPLLCEAIPMSCTVMLPGHNASPPCRSGPAEPTTSHPPPGAMASQRVSGPVRPGVPASCQSHGSHRFHHQGPGEGTGLAVRSLPHHRSARFAGPTSRPGWRSSSLTLPLAVRPASPVRRLPLPPPGARGLLVDGDAGSNWYWACSTTRPTMWRWREGAEQLIANFPGRSVVW